MIGPNQSLSSVKSLIEESASNDSQEKLAGAMQALSLGGRVVQDNALKPRGTLT
jgi:hypothetical protein